MLFEQSVQFASLSDIGFRRQNNQDSFAVHICKDREDWVRRGHLFVVCDGMGGHAVGELASKLAVDTIPHAFQKSLEQDVKTALLNAIVDGNRVINERGTQNREFERMGTTCTALTLGSTGVLIGHVGDSRAYRVRGSQIDQLTADHSLVWEMIQQRRVHPKDASSIVPKNIITRSLGVEPTVNVDMEGPFPALSGDVYVLCSDGLTNLVSDQEIGVAVRELAPADACRFLVNLANLRGGIDNITVIAVRLGAMPEGVSLDGIPESESREIDGRSFARLAWVIAMVVSCGFGMSLVINGPDWRAAGLALIGLSVFLLAVGWIFRKNHVSPTDKAGVEADSMATVLWRPYRTASARATPELIDRLARLHAELQKAAREEEWSIDWAEHDDLMQKFTLATMEKRLSRAFRDLTKVIGMLMSGVQAQRRRLKRESRWGPVRKPNDTSGS
ncbi:Phosphoprotein phosphatase [Planctopirus limnophila DSM 3776]|uniref:Phosphoprotein phosphatase n=1 Tax=Planctopirus limnophila (strain ATCC 43296 / DSM 3776 / IFAM 1008 / Mu 290) TaxID=521674 RepID=D5SYY2_PLAL2|nr:PP2C family serine/threonine-protein phosphatase [Planctopirus limnophila]ADG67914.1 Phosphoprotein phosphatase [Planctopirus limnophila DSM 3776]